MKIKYNFNLNTIDEIIEWYGKYEKHDIQIIAAYDTFSNDLNLPIIIYDSGKNVDCRDLIKDKQIQITSVELNNNDYIIVYVFARNKEAYIEYDFKLKSYESFSSMYNDVCCMFTSKRLFTRHIVRIYLDGQLAVIDNVRYSDLNLFDKVFDQGVKVVSISYFNNNRCITNRHILSVTIDAKRSEKARTISIFNHLCQKYKIFTGGLYKEE